MAVRVFGPAAPCGWSGHLVCSCTRPSAPDPGRTYANPDSEVPKSTPTNSSGEGAGGAGAGGGSSEAVTLGREEAGEEAGEEAEAARGREANLGARDAGHIRRLRVWSTCLLPLMLAWVTVAAGLVAGPALPRLGPWYTLAERIMLTLQA